MALKLSREQGEIIVAKQSVVIAALEKCREILQKTVTENDLNGQFLAHATWNLEQIGLYMKEAIALEQVYLNEIAASKKEESSIVTP